jgi:hypothetical protein
MVAPRNIYSEQMMRAMMLSRFEGFCRAWASPRLTARLLAGWEPADLVTGGFPQFPRLHVRASRDDLVLRSCLGQPLTV